MREGPRAPAVPSPFERQFIDNFLRIIDDPSVLSITLPGAGVSQATFFEAK